MLNAITARDLAFSAIEAALIFAPRTVCVDFALAFYKRGTDARQGGDLGAAVAHYRHAVLACARALQQPLQSWQVRDYYEAVNALSDREAGLAA